MSITTPIKSNKNDRSASNESKRSIAYSMDLLIPGLYIWLGSFTIRLFGSVDNNSITVRGSERLP
jgi:hypothetical protein